MSSEIVIDDLKFSLPMNQEILSPHPFCCCPANKNKYPQHKPVVRIAVSGYRKVATNHNENNGD